MFISLVFFANRIYIYFKRRKGAKGAAAGWPRPVAEELPFISPFQSLASLRIFCSNGRNISINSLKMLSKHWSSENKHISSSSSQREGNARSKNGWNASTFQVLLKSLLSLHGKSWKFTTCSNIAQCSLERENFSSLFMSFFFFFLPLSVHATRVHLSYSKVLLMERRKANNTRVARERKGWWWFELSQGETLFVRLLVAPFER